ncbi:hypothetical protein KCP74_10555 [Salmonella enterica subsp. enterica]|nr:hypothetical protein KCP74_10555 [Salmonella enterica subsp. enterica]
MVRFHDFPLRAPAPRTSSSLRCARRKVTNSFDDELNSRRLPAVGIADKLINPRAYAGQRVNRGSEDKRALMRNATARPSESRRAGPCANTQATRRNAIYQTTL